MSAFDQAMETIHKIHSSKASDYAIERGEFHNFEMAATEANISTAQFIEGLIANKNERRKSLEYRNNIPNHESLADTLLDRAVYAIIRYAHYMDTITGSACEVMKGPAIPINYAQDKIPAGSSAALYRRKE